MVFACHGAGAPQRSATGSAVPLPVELHILPSSLDASLHSVGSLSIFPVRGAVPHCGLAWGLRGRPPRATLSSVRRPERTVTVGDSPGLHGRSRRPAVPAPRSASVVGSLERLTSFPVVLVFGVVVYCYQIRDGVRLVFTKYKYYERRALTGQAYRIGSRMMHIIDSASCSLSPMRYT